MVLKAILCCASGTNCGKSWKSLEKARLTSMSSLSAGWRAIEAGPGHGT